MPAVAATDSWNPIAWTSHGSRTNNARTAAARIVPVVRGLPSRMPSKRETRHRPGPKDRRLGAGEDHEQHDHADPQREPSDRTDLQHAGERQHRRQHHRDVLSRYHEQVPEPGRLEVARGDRVELRGVAQDEPEQQPGFARREDPLDRVADERADDLGHPDEGRRGAADPLDLDRANADGETPMRERGREAGVVGDLKRALDPEPVAADGLGHRVVAADPRSSREGAAPPDHETSLTSTSACQPNELGSGSSRSVARSVTVRGARRRSSECSARTAPRPAQPTPQSSTPATTSAMRLAGAAPVGGRPWGDRRYGGNRIAVGESRRAERVVAACAREPAADGAGEGDAAEQEPRPPRPGRRRGGPEVPQEHPGPERGCDHRRAPALHRTVTPSPGSGGPRGSRGRSRTPRRADRSTRTARARCGTG